MFGLSTATTASGARRMDRKVDQLTRWPVGQKERRRGGMKVGVEVGRSVGEAFEVGGRLVIVFGGHDVKRA